MERSYGSCLVVFGVLLAGLFLWINQVEATEQELQPKSQSRISITLKNPIEVNEEKHPEKIEPNKLFKKQVVTSTEFPKTGSRSSGVKVSLVGVLVVGVSLVVVYVKKKSNEFSEFPGNDKSLLKESLSR